MCGAGGGPCGQPPAAAHVLGRARAGSHAAREARCGVTGIGAPTGEARARAPRCRPPAPPPESKGRGAQPRRRRRGARGPPRHPGAVGEAASRSRRSHACARQSAGTQPPYTVRRGAGGGGRGSGNHAWPGRCVQTLCPTRPGPPPPPPRRGRQSGLAGPAHEAWPSAAAERRARAPLCPARGRGRPLRLGRARGSAAGGRGRRASAPADACKAATRRPTERRRPTVCSCGSRRPCRGRWRPAAGVRQPGRRSRGARPTRPRRRRTSLCDSSSSPLPAARAASTASWKRWQSACTRQPRQDPCGTPHRPGRQPPAPPTTTPPTAGGGCASTGHDAAAVARPLRGHPPCAGAHARAAGSPLHASKRAVRGEATAR